jgi:hypothetical protein
MSVLLEDTGTPIITPNGNFIVVSGLQEFKQRIINIFSTFLNSEILHPEYGFDFPSLLRENLLDERNNIFRSLAFDALQPKNIFNLAKIISLETSITGTTGFIAVSFTTLDGQSYNSNLTIGGFI